MASKNVLRQHFACALFEGFCGMLQDQGAGGGDLQFDGICKRVEATCDAAVRVIKRDPGGTLEPKDIARIKRAMEIFRRATFINRPFDLTEPIAMMICVFVDQLARIKNPAKKKAFSDMLSEAENLMAWADPEWVYSGDDGYRAAEIFDGLEV